jgi:hypothetical protein
MAGKRGFEPPPPGPEPEFRFLNFREKKREGKFSVVKGLEQAFIGADSRNLKMRRLPPTFHQGTPARALARKAAQPRRIRIIKPGNKRGFNVGKQAS